MIESFRENGLNARPNTSHLKISRLELLLASVFHNLNKRLPTTQQVDTDKSISLLLHFLLSAYDRFAFLQFKSLDEKNIFKKNYRQNLGRVTIFAVKVGLSTLCVGKFLDKLKCIVRNYVHSKIFG